MEEGNFIYGTTINEEEVVRDFRDFVTKFVESGEATYLKQLRKIWEQQEDKTKGIKFPLQ
ncbi:unnamed protein product, partial [Durusdinium trenchii]